MPSRVVPAKNSTLLIEPPDSLAVAVTGMVAGAVNACPALGLVIDTAGPVGVVAPLQATPLRVNAVGAALPPELVAVKPRVTELPVPSVPFQLELVTVTFWPLCDQVPFQPLLTFWLPGKAKPSVHELSAAPLLVTSMLPWNPLDQSLVTV